VTMYRIVVGVDGSDGGRQALHWAALLVAATAAESTAPLGRVSRSLVERAGCPVAVVRITP
jgi:nucleotide-binding universal stress UspA family protein